MSKFVDRPRYSCSLGGALSTLRAIPRAIPIIHASAGCGHNLFNAMNPSSGYLGGGYCGGSSLPSSNVIERDIVFGGTDRLREQIETTLEVMDGDIYIVVTGCMVEMIGDDVLSVVSEFSDYDKPVLAIPTPSFRGNSFEGYELILKGLIKNYISKSRIKEEKTVNVLGIVPAQDVFWKGNLKEIKRLLRLLGLKVNTFFGEGETLEDIKNSAKAELNIVVSDIYGIEAAREFEDRHEIPYITVPLPIGALQTEKFLRKISEKLKIDKELTERVIDEEKDIYYDYFERIADIYNDIDLQRYSVVVADSNYAPSLSRFLSDELGWIPELAVITDFVNDGQKKILSSRFENFESGISTAVRFDTDASSVKKYLREVWEPNRNERYYDSLTPNVVFGSVFERDLAAEFNLPLVTVSYPITNRVVFNRAYAGFNGGLSLTEDIITTLVAGR